MQYLVETFGGGDAAAAVRQVEEIVRRLGLREPATSCHTMISRRSQHIAGSIDPSRSGNNPVIFSLDELREILTATLA